MAFPEQSLPLNQSSVKPNLSQANFGARACQLVDDPYVSTRQPNRALALDSRNNGIVDDAIHFEFRDQTLVGCVSVAHLSARVERASALERNLLRVGRSVFNGDYCAVALFPREIHPTEIGLVVGQIRPTVSCELFFDRQYNLYDAKFFLSATKLSQRCSYVDSVKLFGDHEENQAMRAGLLAVRKLSELRMEFGGGAFLTVCDGHIERFPSANIDELIKNQPGAFISAELMIIYNYLASRMVGDKNLHALFRHVSADAAGSTRGLSIVPLAHQGLGLDRYLRATSPCRNAEDYVNQAILTAAILEQPAPFSSDELIEVAQRFESLSKGLAGKTAYTINSYQSDLTAMQWRDFNHAEFSEHLRHCAQQHDFSMALRAELLARIADGQLYSGDLYHVLFGTRNCAADWSEVRQAAVAALESRPYAAADILKRAGVERPYALLRTETRVKHGSGKSFATKVTYFEGNDLIESATIIGSSLRDVAATAALDVLRQVAANKWKPLDEQEQTSSQGLQIVELRGNHTPDSTAELFQKFVSSLENPQLSYTLARFRLPHSASCEVSMIVTHSIGEFRSRTYRARSQAVAERAAEYELLIAHGPANLQDSVSKDAPKNAITKLFSECERAHFGRPEFEHDLFFPKNMTTHMLHVYGYVRVSADQFIFGGPFNSVDRSEAKLLVAQQLLEKIRRYWGGETEQLVDEAFIRSHRRRATID